MGLQEGWSGTNCTQWHLVGEGMALLAKNNIPKSAADIQDEVISSAVGSFLYFD